MKKEAIIGGVVSLFFMILLLVFVPDIITLIFMAVMYTIYVLGYVLGIVRISKFNEALRYGRRSIRRAKNVQTESAWLVLKDEDCVFGDDDLDDEFKTYCQRMDQIGEKASMVLPIEEYINEEFFAVNTRQNLLSQIPGTMTSLGILGTFIGMILGIGGMGFSSLNLALESIETLLDGIELAFYTSIVGVILAIIFNLTYHIISERNSLELQLFLRDYHRYVLPRKDDAMLEHQLMLMEHIANKVDDIAEQPKVEIIEKVVEVLPVKEEVKEELPPAEEIPVIEEVKEEPPIIEEEPDDDDDDDDEDDDEEVNELGIRYKKSFSARLSLASKEVNEYYSTIKNTFLSYKGVKARFSWGYETFKRGRDHLGMMFIRGKTLVVCLAHNVSEYEDSKYHFKDVSEIIKYSNVPMYVKVKSQRGLKYAIELIEELMQKKEVQAGELSEIDFRFKSKTFDKLMKENLIKVVFTKRAIFNENGIVSANNEAKQDEQAENKPVK